MDASTRTWEGVGAVRKLIRKVDQNTMREFDYAIVPKVYEYPDESERQHHSAAVIRVSPKTGMMKSELELLEGLFGVTGVCA